MFKFIVLGFMKILCQKITHMTISRIVCNAKLDYKYKHFLNASACYKYEEKPAIQ